MEPEAGRVTSLERRVRVHAALADPLRLLIVDALSYSDRSPVELRRLLGLESNLLAHHLDVMEAAGLVGRSRSSGDGRRRYVHLLREALDEVGPSCELEVGPALFVCSANSARSPLAAAAWSRITGQVGESAGTHPADAVHPGAIAAAGRAGLDLRGGAPRSIADVDAPPPLVVTVCDQAHEELGPDDGWLHWSVPDPVPAATDEAFDAALAELSHRIQALAVSGVAP